MAVYDLERFHILLVEDNGYIRNVLEDLFRQFRVGRVATASNGQEAIEYLQMVSKQGAAARRDLDIVISDMIMAPINGLLLLRWLRSAKDSPNRFLPFIMLSGAADSEYVISARESGVTEFMAKPFSARSIYRFVLEIIDFPRQFVATGQYFGPDRRRREVPSGTAERRVRKESDVTIVRNTHDVETPENPSDVWYFRMPNHLQKKAGGMSGGGMGEIPVALLEQAEEKLQRVGLDFTDWATDYLGNLSKLCVAAMGNPQARPKQLEDINLLAHELRGQGGTFGYPLITTFAKSLYDATRPGSTFNDAAVEIVKAHVDAMRAVIREKVSGDGGETGRALLKSLEIAIAKHSAVT